MWHKNKYTYSMQGIKRIQLILEKLSQQMFARSLLALVILVLGTTIALSSSVRTVSAGPGDPFGGQVTYVFYCTCSLNYAIYFNDLTVTSSTGGLPLIYQPGGTITYEFGPPLSTGQWMLGTWQSGGVCTYYAGKSCSTLQTAGTMYMVGTSQ